MTSFVRRRAASAWLGALTSSALALAGCAAAAAGAPAVAAAQSPATAAGGTFAPAGPAAASYGPDAARPCRPSGVLKEVLDQLSGAAKRAGRPEPVADGRVCAVAEAFLGWDPAAKVPPPVLEFVSSFYGLPSSAQPPLVAEIASDDARELADRIVQAVGAPSLEAVRPLIGVTSRMIQRATRSGGIAKTKVSVVLFDGGVEIDPFPRRLEAGQQATLTGRLTGSLSNAKLAVSDPVGRVTTAETPGGADFRIDVKCGDRPGQIRVEIRGERKGQSGVLANFPVACASQLPTSVSLAEPPWPADTGQQERKVLDLVNQERSAAGLGPLAWDDGVAQVARGIAQSLKGGGTGADVRERLKEAGVASPLTLLCLAADRTADRAHERLEVSPTNRGNILNAEATNAGVGLFATTDAANGPIVYLAELFVKEQPPVDAEQMRAKLRDAVAQKRKDARTNPLSADPLLEEVAQKYAQALAAGGGTIPDDEKTKLTAPLDAPYKAVNLVAGAKPDPLDFAEEPQIASAGKSLGVGVAQGKNAVLGRNAVYVVVMVGTPRVEPKAPKATKAAKPKAKR